MTHPNFSVVVLPGAWGDTLAELARTMMPVSRAAPDQVVPLLERGAMTLEADLTREEADHLRDRLTARGIPAQVIDADGEVVVDSAHRASAGGEARETSAPTDDAPINPTDAAQTGPTDGQQWAALFSDVKQQRGDDLGGDGAQSADVPGDSASNFGAEPAPDAPPDAPPDPPPDPPASRPAAGRSPTGNPSTASPPDASACRASFAPERQPREPVREQPEEARARRFDEEFDAAKMSDALHSADGGRPPYAPDGFDDTMAHIPALAGLLSFLAPGAGQVYNGQPDQARRYGKRFVLVHPWYRSIRQAYDYAEKIRGHWAPRPAAGAIWAAAKYVGVWWLGLAAVVAGLWWSTAAVFEQADAPPEAPSATRADVASALDEATTQIQIARIRGLDGASAFVDHRSRQRQRFTMSKEERAQRLFRRGAAFCRRGEYATCESAMKRVSTLSATLRRDAFRLQAWASVQQDSASDDRPMPEVEAIDSLQTYEHRQMDRADADEVGPKAGADAAGR